MTDRIIGRLYFLALAAALELAGDEIAAILDLAEGRTADHRPPTAAVDPPAAVRDPSAVDSHA